MVLDLSNFSPSDFAAWWGAVIATLALVWNIVVALRSGARLRVRVSPNIRVFPPQPPTYDNDYISVTVVNVGNGPTTITHFAGYFTKNIFGLLLKSQRQHFMVKTHPALGKDIPYVLAPGTEWSHLANQKDLKEKSSGGLLYLGIIHNQSKKPIYQRVKLHV